MCGIAGTLALRLGTMPTALVESLDRQRHRGPDASGSRTDGRCWLGHLRLAIIDLSDAGCQPIGNEDDSVRVTYNGEIYNYRELRAELEAGGHRFRSATDTEVLVHGYEQWGEALVPRLRGMFAFAIWDSRRQRMLLARDRVGKKPLCYAQTPHEFVFASEIQGILAHPAVSKEANPDALVDYLTWGYVPAPSSAFADVRKLPPAHLMTIDLANGTTAVEIRPYWSLTYTPKLTLPVQDLQQQLRAELTEAVDIRLMSDVPLGAFLSGGMDSTIVVGLMAQASAAPVRTFSIGFEEAGFNELPHARRVAERWGTDHTELVVQPHAVEILPTLVRHYGEPFGDSSAIPTFYVAQLTRRSVTVALNGDGGDESFAGYERYWGNVAAQRLRALRLVLAGAGAVFEHLPLSSRRTFAGKAQRFLAAAGRPAAARYAHWSSYFDGDLRKRLVAPMSAARQRAHEPEVWMDALFADTTGLGSLDQVLSVDVRSYLPYDLLVKVDIASMASSLEARSPFLDHRVMEFAARLPESAKLRGRQGKAILRDTFADLLPPENVNRPKMGFGVPVGDWLRGPLAPMLSETLLAGDAAVRRYLDGTVIDELVRAHAAGSADHTPRIWSLLMLELWHREMGATTPWAS